MLGTDFKAGQTKFKTAAVEYIRSLGMCPKVPTSIVLYLYVLRALQRGQQLSVICLAGRLGACT